jgi:hypothetical protein
MLARYRLIIPTALARTLSVLMLVPLLHPGDAAATPTEFVIDSVVASVNDQPITLSDVMRRLGGRKSLTLQEIATDVAAQRAVDARSNETNEMPELPGKPPACSDYVPEPAGKQARVRLQFDLRLPGSRGRNRVRPQPGKDRRKSGGGIDAALFLVEIHQGG